MCGTTSNVVLIVLLLSICPGFPLPLQPETISPFSDESLQPTNPSFALNSSYSLLQELSSWSDLSVAAILITQLPEVFQLLWTSSNTLFAPTNDVLRSLFTYISAAIPPDASPSIIARRVINLSFVLESYFASVPSLSQLMMYHIIAQNISEFELVESSTFSPLYGPPLNFSKYPTQIIDVDSIQNSSRLARQISTPTSRIAFVSSLLLPFNVQQLLNETGFPKPEIVPHSGALFGPLRSLLNFASARNDMIFLKTLLARNESLRVLLASPTHLLHLFAPNDFAFVHLVRSLLPEFLLPSLLGNVEEALLNVSKNAAILQGGGEVELDKTLGNHTELELFFDRVAAVWDVLRVVPTLEEVILYHILNTSSSYTELTALGPQRTLLAQEYSPASKLSVSDQGVEDASEREPASKIISLATRNGIVTVLDSVLVPFKIEEGKRIIAGVLDTITPAPSKEKPLISEEAKESSLVEEDSPVTNTDPPPMVASPSMTPRPGQEAPPECFPSSSNVRLLDGTNIRIDKLEAGTHVHVGDGRTSRVFLFTHKKPNITATFVRIYTTSGRSVSLTRGHYIYVNGRLTAAASVREGDILNTEEGLATVERTERVILSGLYAPHTFYGDLMVDGIRVSCYSTALHPSAAQALLSPLRYLAVRGWNEPLGSIFYGGAKHVATILSRGSSVV